jgi:phospholipid/cholesterol/gamma-HCH transport system ATP-binding protein
MARRVALARALALDPMMIMYDEPFTGQDPISLGVLVKLIRETNQALKLTSILVSHDVTETLSIADDVKIISEGKVVAAGTKDEIVKSDSPWVRQFIDGEADGPVPFHYPGDPIDQQLLQGVS